MKRMILLTFIGLFFLAILNSSCTKPGDPSPNTPSFSLATVTTTAPSSITITAALSGGTIISNGGDSITDRGICLATVQNPTIQNTKIASGSGNGNFVCTINGLSPTTTYYIRAYAINTAGTAYGNQQTITTNTSGLLYRIEDSLSAAVYESIEYDANKKLTKYTVSNPAFVDTFIYNGNALSNSFYSLGSVLNSSAPYSKTDYQLQNNLPASSKYYLGTSNLVTTSVYTFDGSGRISQVKQTQINGSVGSYPTYTTRFEYDANSNLSKIYYKEDPYPEYVCMEFLNYDNKENPFYNMPWLFDYNIFQNNTNKLSKNNVGIVKTYASFQGSTPILNKTDIYIYEYDADGKIAKRKILGNGTSTGTKYFYYKYQ